MKLTSQQSANLLELAEVLESNKYKQGRGALRTEDGGFCCLGIACDLFKEKTNKGSWNSVNEFVLGGESNSQNLAYLPEVLNYFGFFHPNGFKHDGNYLTSHNDGYTNPVGKVIIPKKSFKEIAGLILKYVKENYSG